MDLVHGLLEWTAHGLPWVGHPEMCGGHRFNYAGTRGKDAIDRQTQLRNTCDLTKLMIPNKRCDRSEQLPFNPQTFPTLTSGHLLQNVGFE